MTDNSKDNNATEVPLSPVVELLKAHGLQVTELPRDKTAKVRIFHRPKARIKPEGGADDSTAE